MSSETTDLDLSDPVVKKIVHMIREKKGIPEDKEIQGKDNLVWNLGFDSIDTVSFVMDIEEEFDISISDEIAEEIRSVSALVTCVKTRVTS